MKVEIGPYVTWWGPYQLAGLLKYVGVNDDRCHEIGSWLSDTWLNDLCQKIHDLKKRKIKVRIDNHDIWSMDETLAHIIHPMLVKLRETKHGSCPTDFDDAPPEFTGITQEYGSDSMIHERWDWILGEMIFTFNHIANEDEYAFDDEFEAKEARIKNGLRLFGKYFRGLWD